MLDMVYYVSITVEITMTCNLINWTLSILRLASALSCAAGVDNLWHALETCFPKARKSYH